MLSKKFRGSTAMMTGPKYNSAMFMQVKAMRRVSAGVMLVAVLPLAAQTAPPERTTAGVKGEFAFTGTEHCTYASSFGPPPALQATGTANLHASTLQGTLELAADGTGKLTGRIASLQSLPITGVTPAMQSALTCDVKHSLAANGELRLERACRGTGTRGTGSENAQTWSASPIRESGPFTADMTVLADTQLEPETVSVAGLSLARICHRTVFLTKSNR
jgi:hypothetical protein